MPEYYSIKWKNMNIEERNEYKTHCQMLGKVESVLPAKIGRLVGCTEMIS